MKRPTVEGTRRTLRTHLGATLALLEPFGSEHPNSFHGPGDQITRGGLSALEEAEEHLLAAWSAARDLDDLPLLNVPGWLVPAMYGTRTAFLVVHAIRLDPVADIWPVQAVDQASDGLRGVFDELTASPARRAA